MIEIRSELTVTPLFRAIDEAYAERFVAGHIRLTQLREYRKEEYGDRRDITEHNGQLNIRGDNDIRVHYSVEPVWPVYVLCMFAAGGSAGKLASCCLRIDDPNRLVHSLAGAVAAALPANNAPMFLLAGRAEYDKGEASADERPDSERRTWLAVFQKPPGYAPEREWRIAIAAQGVATLAPSHIDVEIGPVLDYVTRL